ncbi:MAG: hypothetical protein ACREM6_03230, partial [Vulcanimicrobiaceae bacterium]
FQNNELNSSRNELIIVVTPHILRAGNPPPPPEPALPTIPTPQPLPTLPPGAKIVPRPRASR